MKQSIFQVLLQLLLFSRCHTYQLHEIICICDLSYIMFVGFCNKMWWEILSSIYVCYFRRKKSFVKIYRMVSKQGRFCLAPFKRSYQLDCGIFLITTKKLDLLEILYFLSESGSFVRQIVNCIIPKLFCFCGLL